jgi:hypothetical protein
LNERNADREYLQILSHASKNMECDVNNALINIRACQCIPRLESVVAKTRRLLPAPPEMDSFEVCLAEYDQLLQNQEEVAA